MNNLIIVQYQRAVFFTPYLYFVRLQTTKQMCLIAYCIILQDYIQYFWNENELSSNMEHLLWKRMKLL